MAEKLTEELLNELLFTNSFPDFIASEYPYGEESLSEFLNSMIKSKNLQKSDVIKDSHLNQTFAYQLFAGSRGASKYKLVQLAFAMGLSLRETQRLLKIAGSGELYCKNRRDAIIIYCISENMSLAQTEETLFSFNEPTICEE